MQPHFLIIAVFLIGAALLTGLLYRVWLPFLGRFLVVSSPLNPADAVVTLGGEGALRIPSAAVLLKKGYARWLVILDSPLSVPGVRESYQALAQREAIWQGAPAGSILTLPGRVTTTCEEALNVRRFAEKEGWRSLIVSTSPYHTRRARWIFQDVFRGTGIQIMVHPIDDHWYQPARWWQDANSLRETWTEYNKLAVYLLGYR
jgi:uncharacterized SAM-binding protein YcdF (DUF218 family)